MQNNLDHLVSGSATSRDAARRRLKASTNSASNTSASVPVTARPAMSPISRWERPECDDEGSVSAAEGDTVVVMVVKTTVGLSTVVVGSGVNGGIVVEELSVRVVLSEVVVEVRVSE